VTTETQPAMLGFAGMLNGDLADRPGKDDLPASRIAIWHFIWMKSVGKPPTTAAKQSTIAKAGGFGQHESQKAECNQPQKSVAHKTTRRRKNKAMFNR
jgi:hypothetical protein